MKKRFLSALLSLCIMVTLLPGTAAAANNLIPAISNNIGRNHYSGGLSQSSILDGVTVYSTSAWASSINSYLYQDGQYLVRVEYISGHIVIEYYTSEYEIVSAKSLEMDAGFDLWGGFYSGKNYNFIIIGQGNLSADDNVEVIRVIKYDKNWHRLGQVGLFGGYTSYPFESGSLRCAEYNGVLYIHSPRNIYASDFGIYHQAELTLVIRESDMTITNDPKIWRVSHSFNQFIIADKDGNIITLDHGDGWPRAAVLMKFSSGIYYTRSGVVNVREFPLDQESSMMDNSTGASLGGLTESSTGYITAFNDDGLGINSQGDRSVHNIYLSHTSKNNFSESGTNIRQITNFSADGNYSTGTPVLVSTGLDGGYVLWEVRELTDGHLTFPFYQSTGKIAYVTYSADGSTSEITTVDGYLSDCQPIIYNGKVIWYVTNDGPPVFYTLDSTGLSSYLAGSSFVDVKPSMWYTESIEFAHRNNLIDGYDSGEFKPNSNADRGTVVVALYRLWGAYSTSYRSSFSDIDISNLELNSAVEWATGNTIRFKITSGYGDGRFGPNDPVTREQLAAFFYRYAAFKRYDTNSRTNLSQYTDRGNISDYALEAMQWAVSQGLISGTSSTTLSPKNTVTRAQLAAILMRFCENIEK